MIPYPSQTLADIAQRIATHLLPELDSEFAQADAGLIMGLLLTFSQDYERAIDARMEDIKDMQTLFAALPADTPALEKMRAYVGQAPASLKLADVNQLHGEGLRHLIAVHAWAEAHDEDLDQAIWQLLRRHSERHKFELLMP